MYFFVPNPIQRMFIESRANADLFASRMGEGKTTALVFSCFYHTLYNPGANWVFIRETWDNLEQTTLQEFMNWFSDFGKYIPSKKRFDWNWPLTGKIWFVPADSISDARRLQSRPLAGVAIDEAVPVSHAGGINEVIFDIAFGRLRQPGVKWRVCKLAANNPDKGHWVYKRFVDPGTNGFKVWQTQSPENLSNLDADYYDRLRSAWQHRPDLIKRYVEGEYAILREGEPVIKTFSWAKNVKEFDLSGKKELIALWDGGSTPACLICQMIDDDRLYVHEEYYGVGIGLYELIRNNFIDRKYSGYKFRHIGDESLSKRDQARSHYYDMINSASNVITNMLGGEFVSGARGIDSRVLSLSMALANSKLFISRHCEKLIEGLSGAWAYQNNMKPNKLHPWSDLCDALTYGTSVIFPNEIVKSIYDFPISKRRYFAVGT